MSCLKIKDIYDYLENDLPAERRKQVEDHLKACSQCQKILEDRKTYLELFSSLPDYHLPEDFAQKILSNLPSLHSPAKGWLVLAGGVYLLFSLTVIALIIGIKSSIFFIVFPVFKYLFNIATALSEFIFQGFQLILALFKAMEVFLKITGEFLKDFLPGSPAALFTLTFAIFLSLAIGWFLIKSIHSSPRRENHEN